MTLALIETPEDVAKGAAWLSQVEPRFGDVLAATGPWPLRRRPGGFSALLFAIVGQQVSVASAAAVWARVQAAGFDDLRAASRADAADWRACGFSRPKIRYATALAQSGFDYLALETLPDEQVMARLTDLLGIGQWTADIYAMFALGRADVIAGGDLAMQEAAKVLFDLPARPTDRELRALAEPWAPWRAVAARGLWAYYAHIKTREGIA